MERTGLTLMLAVVAIVATPARAAEERSPACKAAQSYVDFLTSNNPDGIGGLFAERPDYTGPTGAKLHKPVDIANAYRALLAKSDGRTQYRTTDLVPVGANRCLLQFDRLDASGKGFVPWAIDDFQVDAAGKVVRFVPYLQSDQVKRMYDIINGGNSAAKPR